MVMIIVINHYKRQSSAPLYKPLVNSMILVRGDNHPPGSCAVVHVVGTLPGASTKVKLSLIFITIDNH